MATPPVASVNPIQATSDPEYTSYRWSRPIGAFEGNKSTAIAVEGGAKALTEGVNATDTLIKNSLEHSIEQTAGAKRDAYSDNLEQTLSSIRGDGGLAYASAEANAGTEPNKKLDILTADKDAKNLPVDLKSLPQKLDQMTQRKANGSISETKYRGDIDALAKQYRNAWPGYIKDIDETFDRVTMRGVANAAIQAKVADLNAFNAAAKAKAGEVDKLLTHAETVDHIPGANVWRQRYEAGQWPEAKVRAMYNQSMGWKFEEEYQKGKVGIATAKDELASKEGQRYINTVGSNAIKDFFATIDPSEQPDKILQELKSDKIDGQHAELYAQHLDATVQQAKAIAMQKALDTKTSDGRTLLETMGPEKLNQLLEDNPHIKLAKNVITQLVGTKDHSAAVSATNSLSALTADDSYKLANADTPLGRLYRAERVWEKVGGMGGKLAADAMESGNLVKDARAWMDSGLKVGGTQPDKPNELMTFQSHYNEAVLNGKESPAALKLLTDKVAGYIADTSLKPEVRENYMEMAYDAKNLQFLERLEPDHIDPQTGQKVKGQVWFYRNLTSEGHAASVAEVAKTSGHPEIWDKYNNYVTKAGEYLIGTELPKLNAALEAETGVKASYDNEHQRFKVETTPRTPYSKSPIFTPGTSIGSATRELAGRIASKFPNRQKEKEAQQSVDKINEVLKSYATMAKNDPSHPDPNVYAYERLIEMAPPGSISEKMLKAVMMTAEPKEETNPRKGPK